MTGLLPQPTRIDRPYWECGRDGVLRMPKCRSCGHVFFPPGPRCTACGSPELDWAAMSGRGTIWSWVVFHRPYFDGMPTPYTCIRVKLEEGPALITNLVDAGGREPQAGDAVRVVFEQARDIWLPQFTYA